MGLKLGHEKLPKTFLIYVFVTINSEIGSADSACSIILDVMQLLTKYVLY